MSKQIEHVHFVSTLSKGRNFTIESFDIVAVCGNNVECCFDKVERCFDIVAGVDGALLPRSHPHCLHKKTRTGSCVVIILFLVLFHYLTLVLRAVDLLSW